MKVKQLLLWAAIPLFLTACGLSPQEKADYAAVEGAAISPAIYDKMLHDDDLSIHDIEVMARAHVNSGIVLRYIRNHGSIYYMSSRDVTDMQKAGVDPSVIDYMLQTARGGYWGYGPYPYYGSWGGFGYDPFFGPGFYGGPYYFGGGYYHHWHGGGYYHHH